MSEKSELVEIAALWANTSKAGEKYMRGYLGNAELLLFRNKFKEEEKHPDFRLYVAKKEKREEKPVETTTNDIFDGDDDIPF